MPEAQSDIFLSYHRSDDRAVGEIAEELGRRGLKPWLDLSDIAPGQRWAQALAEGLAASRAVAILVGADGLGAWQTFEMETAIDLSIERGVPVIPVLLPGAPDKPELPLFLRAFQWVDLRWGITPEGLDRLQAGIPGQMVEGPPMPGSAARRGPARHNLPYLSLRSLFKGREQELLHLAADLNAAGTAAIAQNQVLSGLGGIGKTRLAVEYAWRYGHRYRAVLFVRADSPQGLRRGLAALAAADLLDLPERHVPNEDEIVAAVLGRLQQQQAWLLILDNVDTKEAAAAVSELLPRLSAGHVLITSRWTRWGPALPSQALEKLPPAEAVRFLLERTAGRRTAGADDPADARRLAERLDGLPLALGQAAAYIARHRLSFAAYLAASTSDRRDALAWYDPQLMDYPEPLALTWQRSFEALPPPAATLLRLCAFLAPDPVPVALFEDGRKILREAAALLGRETGHEPSGEHDVRAALADLADYSLITWTEPTFSVHAMVQEVLRSRIPAELSREWIESSLRLVTAYAPFDADDVRTWPVWNLLRPHAVAVLRLAEGAECLAAATDLMSQLALLLHTRALYDEAEPLMRRALRIDEASFGSDHPDVATDLNNLAQLLQATDRLAEAEPLMQRALHIDEARFGADHSNVARDLNNLAQLLQDTNRLAEAEPLMRRALRIDEASFGADHPAVARDLNNLALLLQATERLAEAEPLMRRALHIDEASFGANHPEVATDLNNLAQLLQATDRLVEAEPLMRRALAVRQTSLGDTHPLTQAAKANLDALLERL